MILGEDNWNLLAAVIGELFKLGITDEKIQKFIARSEGVRNTYQKQVYSILQKNHFPENTSGSIYDELFDTELKNRTEIMLTALLYIDRKLSFGGDVSHFIKKDTILGEMIELNSNVDETGIILLPKVKCEWERKHQSGLRSLVDSYTFVRKQDLGEYIVKNYLFNQSAAELLKNENYIRVAVSPLTDANILQVDRYEREDVKLFAIKDIEQDETGQEMLKRKVLGDIRWATELGADILVYPEMLGTGQIVKEALKEIAEEEMQNRRPPFLVLLPTVWKADRTGMQDRWQEGNNTNVLYVAMTQDILDGASFKAAIAQQKQNPYLDSEGGQKGRLEDIKSDKVIHVLHLPGLGRVVFPICADLINEEYRNKLFQILGANLILCPSFSKGVDEFIQIAARGNEADCRVIWCNSCAVRHLYQYDSTRQFEVGDICCAGISGMARDYYPIKPNPVCNRECKKYCLFYIDVPMKNRLPKAQAKQLGWYHFATDDNKEEAV